MRYIVSAHFSYALLIWPFLLCANASCSSSAGVFPDSTEMVDSVPGFRASPQTFSPMGTFQLALEDLDADGDLDVVFSNMQTPSRVFLNDGQGYFHQTSQTLEYGLHGIAIGDLDMDGTPDLIFAGNRSDDLASRVYFNRGDGHFDASPVPLADGPDNAVGIGLYDIENDGDLDAIVHYISPARINILFLNDGSGAFDRTNTSYPPYSSFGDLNGDGYVDMIARETGVSFTTHLNDGAGSLPQSGAVSLPGLGYGSGLFEDIDNDGDQDFIYTSGETDDIPAGVLLNDGAGGMTESGQVLASVTLGRICAGDLDNDGWIDLIVTDLNVPPAIWMNDGQGRLTDSGTRLTAPNAVRSCEIGDLDGDGDNDVFIANYSQGSNEVWFNQFIPEG